MTTATYAGVTVELNDEGFFERPEQWTPDIGAEIARAAGIDPLTDRHLLVIDHVRRQFLATGTGPAVRALAKGSGVSVKELYELFPAGPAKLAARIAGIPKPKGCI